MLTVCVQVDDLSGRALALESARLLRAAADRIVSRELASGLVLRDWTCVIGSFPPLAGGRRRERFKWVPGDAGQAQAYDLADVATRP